MLEGTENFVSFTPIQNYGLIGNMRSAALVSTSGAIDFFCFPEFDSPTLFAALLDNPNGGSFTLGPDRADGAVKQLYLPETNVLLTRFLAPEGIVELTDFMAIPDPAPAGKTEPINCIVRRIAVISGAARIAMRCSLRFDYARATHTAAFEPSGIVFTPAASACPPVRLWSSVALRIEDGDACASFDLQAGESACFVFGTADGVPPGPQIADWVESQFHATSEFWRSWSARSSYTGRWREMVNRSALVLKLLTSSQHGSVIAAPTFGLPEVIGGERNWDYRYTWLRDASFTLYALMRIGYTEEGHRFNLWLRDRIRFDGENGPLQVMYGVDGRAELPESELDGLAGYGGSRPVRIGNAAFTQLQLDIYGETLDAIYLSNKYGDGISHEGWDRLKQTLQWLAKHWRDPDEGIWEVRGGRRCFLHSRLMCWVAFDRGIRLGYKRSLPGPYGWMEECRDAIVRDIHENFWDAELGAFVQSQGAKAVDAATLLMPLLRFISPIDPRWLSTLAVIERDLTVDTLVKRYRPENAVDGLHGIEGSFTPCSFWFIEALARSHQVEKAHLLFEKMLSYANHLGLYSEELGASGEHLGNYPQALTHLALISAATYLDRRLAEKRREPWS
jgi:GH15 family glucan-1,4-alpha-glucosidase